MGASKRKKAAFFAAHPRCCFCGGTSHASTIDHVPARACFRGRVGPEGFEFPACEDCNSSSRLSEQVFGFYVRIFNQEDGDAGDIERQVLHLRNNASECIPESGMTVNEKRRVLEKWGMELPPGKMFADIGLVRIPQAAVAHVKSFGRKLALALYYKELGSSVPPEHSVLVGWSQAQIPSSQEALDLLAESMPGLEVGTRRNTDLGDQFSYRWGLNSELGLFGATVRFGASMVLLCAVAPTVSVSNTEIAAEWAPA